MGRGVHPLPCGVQPEGARLMGSLQLGQSLDAAAGKASPGVAPLPGGFLEDLAANSEPEALDAIFQPIGGTSCYPFLS